MRKSAASMSPVTMSRLTAFAIGRPFERVVAKVGRAQARGVVQRAPVPPAVINPIISPASQIIVVKKPHTNPARVAITLRTSARSRVTGTLTRVTVPTSGGIHIFRNRTTPTEMQFNGTDNVFTAQQLSDGVRVFATADRPSGSANDFQLTLTLPLGPTAGPPTTVSLTAVELTLDVGLSRPSPGVAPPIMSANDKINIGRFVQVRNPGFEHERAMIILRPPNPQVPLVVRLEALTAQLRAFGIEEPFAGQGSHPRPATFPSDLLTPNPFELFVEATAASTGIRDMGFRYGVDGVENEADRVAMTAVQVEIADSPNPAVAAATFVRMGLWDHAFRPAGSPLGPLFNQQAEVDNFVGADSRKFHIRVRDVAARNTGSRQADWITLDERQNNDDAPATRDVTLVETAANTGVFVSRGLMLVSGIEDQNQATHTGLAAPLPDAGLTQGAGLRNHRIRKTNVRGVIKVEYRPAAGIALPLRLPVFQRSPESRKRLPLQIFVLRVAAGGNGVINTGPRNTPTASVVWTRDLPAAEEAYARLGIEIETVVAPTTPAADIQEERPMITNENVRTSGPDAFKLQRTPVVTDPGNSIEVRPATGAVRTPNIIFENVARDPNAGEVKIDRSTGDLTFNAAEQPGAQDRIVATYVVVGHRLVLLTAPAGVNPLAVRFQNPSPAGPPLDDEATIASNSPSIPNTIRVYYTGGLPSQGAAAESWPDFNFSAKPQVGCSFISAPQEGLGTLSHEIGHVLTNKSASVNTGHYRKPPPPNRLEDPQNLMANLASPGAPGVTIRKRLWDAVDADGVVNQFTNVRNRRFTRGF